MSSLTLQSPAKLNLYLKVINKRPDGYHNLTTLFERIDLADQIRFVANATGKIRIFCRHPQVPRGPKNLVYRVARLLQDRHGIKQGVDMHITKRIPVAAGLAGGSSNAATAIKGLNKIWGLKLTRRQMVDYAAQVGSDVAFFLYESSWALGTGRGERIRTLAIPARLWHVLVVPRIKMYSREVFTRLNLELTKKDDDVSILIHYLKKNSISMVGNLLFNDLQSSILQIRPPLALVKERLQTLGVQGVSFSGSGPAVFGLVASRTEANKFRALLKKRYAQVFVVRTL